MNSLFLAVGCLGFFYKTANLSRSLSLCATTAALLPAYSILPSPMLRKNNGERVERSRDPHRVQEVSSLLLVSLSPALHQLSNSCGSRSITF
jgi:hypothetical protein